ncbi:glycerol-3-phosphate dehydrogenase [Syntrophus gentianae]|uniref:Glycerol-3-phosphate dehydrogenase n=1 Tax=Syntrophus gentianae TaxID=43775 RepID=A0A1H7ZD87_9BACT|nr:NAD(P)/FAD-dependent oxidoreductase [Syntrophus gentianae]SEM56245.1 glycerol-3-phosphate dehydrogenase [Syntrophus gentianae]
MTNFYDVIVIGAGVVGNAIARELSRFDIQAAVLEKELDVGGGTSSRNSGVVHSGIHYKPGTLRAKLDVQGNAMMGPLCKELKVKIQYIGKLTVAQEEADVETLHALKAQGEANGVPGLAILNREHMEKLQPGIGGIMALHSPSTGIICPYGLTIALAENAYANGVSYHLGQEVTAIRRTAEGFEISTAKGESFKSKVLINSAGLYSDAICRMLGIDEYRIYPCRGEYLILDKRLGDSLSLLVYPAPHKGGAGLGIHLTNTVDGNILIGPSNEYVDEADDYASTAEIMTLLKEEGHELLPGISAADFIRNFSGLRAKQAPPSEGGFRDFVIESRKDIPGFINLVGIESPGLTSAPAIGLMVRNLVEELLPLPLKDSFVPDREGRAGFFFELSPEEKADLVAENPDYGEIVCRCEQITRKEVIDAIQNPLGIRTINGLKYRSRAMMGRCQGGFCLPRIVQILEKEFGYRPEDYLLQHASSPLFAGRVR